MKTFLPNVKWRKRIILSIKLIVLLLCIGFIYSQIDKIDIKKGLSLFRENESRKLLIAAVVFLGILNLFTDTMLWFSISNTAGKTTFLSSLSHHLQSLALAVVTPYNVGEFGGKARQFNAPIKKLKALYLTYVFRFVKMSARNFIGALSLLFLILSHHFQSISWFETGFILLLTAGILLMYFNLERIVLLISGMVILGRKYLLPLQRLTHSPAQKSLWFSGGIIKFFIYPFQFLLLLLSLSPETEFSFSLLAIVWVYYSLASLIPSVQLADPLIKGSAGILILSGWVKDPTIIVLATSGVWLINVAIPALLGGSLLLKQKKQS